MPTEYPGITATVLADSTAAGADRVLTLALRYPLVIHPQRLKHGMLRGSTRSMRAAPFAVFAKEVRSDPWAPPVVRAAQKGMQGGAPLPRLRGWLARQAYLQARWPALAMAALMVRCGAHKEEVNRLLTPWAWCHEVVTGTHTWWLHYLGLRDAGDASDSHGVLARRVAEATEGSEPKVVLRGEWGCPYHPGMPGRSAAACARNSFTGHDGKPTAAAADYALARRLERDLHMTPFEHQVTPIGDEWDMKRDGPFRGWRTQRSRIERDLFRADS